MKTKVFVYGTLKHNERGGNFWRVIPKEDFVCSDVTEEKFLMTTVGFPYCFVRSAFPDELPDTVEDLFLPVRGQVMLVDDETLNELDRIEGYPYHYQRRTILTEKGHECLMYVQETRERLIHSYALEPNEQGKWEWL